MPRWKPPAHNVTEINTDAIVFGLNWCGLGVIVRNEHGGIVAAVYKFMTGQATPTLAEVKAMLYGVPIASTLNLSRMEFELDSLILIQGLNNQDSNFSYFGLL